MQNISYIKQGDLAVFKEVFHRYHQKLYFYVLGKTNSSFYAEEVVQLTFIKLWQYRASLNEDISIDAQIFRIAKTTLIDQIRKQESSDKILKYYQNEGEVVENNQGPSNLDHQYLQEQLHLAMSDLPPMRRKVFELSRLHGLSYKEISDRLSISEKTVENHINHALKQLRHSFPLLSILLVLFKNNF